MITKSGSSASHRISQDQEDNPCPSCFSFIKRDLIGMTGLLASSIKYYEIIVEFSWDVDVRAWETFQSSLVKVVRRGRKRFDHWQK
jgi:hypothetical protein